MECPDDHAVQTEEADDEHRLVEHPHQPDIGGKDSQREEHPEPATHSGSGEKRGAHSGNNHETRDPVKLVGGVEEEGRLPALHDVPTREERVDVATRWRSRQSQLVSLAGQSERGQPGRETGEQQVEGHARLALRGVVHELIMTAHREEKLTMCDTGVTAAHPHGSARHDKDFLGHRPDEGISPTPKF